MTTKIRKKQAPLLALTLLAGTALPAAASPQLGLEIGGGLIGLEVNATLKLTNYIGVRGGVNRLAPQLVIDGIVNNEASSTLFRTLCADAPCNDNLFGEPNINVDVNTYNGYLDIYPFGGRFRITGGILYGKKIASSLFRPQDGNTETITIGNTSLNSAYIKSLQTEVELDKYSVYVGLGWNSTMRKKSLFGTFMNLGTLIVIDPQVRVIPSLTSAGTDRYNLEQDSLLEAQKLKNKMRKFPVIPYFSIGVTYRLF